MKLKMKNFWFGYSTLDQEALFTNKRITSGYSDFKSYALFAIATGRSTF